MKGKGGRKEGRKEGNKNKQMNWQAVELRNLVKGKIDALVPEAKEFVNGVGRNWRPDNGELLISVFR